MTLSFTTVDLATGEFKNGFTVPNEKARDLNVPEGFGYVDGLQEIGSVYLLDGEIVARPDMGLLSNAHDAMAPHELLSITNIPPGTRLYGPELDLVIDDGFVEWTSAVAGRFTFVLIDFPYKNGAVNATFIGS
jgi:hypothetical protein